ncbi:hypothetical protein ACFLZC_00060 [Patescibacteria group bacterium]
MILCYFWFKLYIEKRKEFEMNERKISRKGWKSVWRKWQGIREKTMAGERFASSRGFLDILVAEECSYCREFMKPSLEELSCSFCPMSKKMICWWSDGDGFNTPVWRYVTEMQKDEPDFEKAVAFVGEIIIAIKADEPPKE